MYAENTSLKKNLEKLEAAQLQNLCNSLLQNVEKFNGVNFIGELVEVSSTDALKKLAFKLKQDLSDFIIVLTSVIEGKANVVLLFDEDIAREKNLDASALIKQKISPLIRGGGGGQKTLATASGQDSSTLKEVITTVKSLV